MSVTPFYFLLQLYEAPVAAAWASDWLSAEFKITFYTEQDSLSHISLLVVWSPHHRAGVIVGKGFPCDDDLRDFCWSGGDEGADEGHVSSSCDFVLFHWDRNF